MTAVLQSQTGTSRWCETAYAPAAVAETFLRVFPQADFLIVHRSLRGVLNEATESYPWGLARSPFWSYAEPYPGNNAATIASYWAARASGLLGFQTAHPHACLRIRYEDLAADLPQHTARIFAHLGLPANDPAGPGNPPGNAGHAGAETRAGDTGPVLPTGQLPPQLLAEVRDLHAKLDYVWQ
jgi:Sulfotransferase family